MSDNLMDSILGGIPKPADPAKPEPDAKPEPQQEGGKKHHDYSDAFRKEFGDPKA